MSSRVYPIVHLRGAANATDIVSSDKLTRREALFGTRAERLTPAFGAIAAYATTKSKIRQVIFAQLLTTDKTIRRPTLTILLMPTLLSPTTPAIIARLFLYLMVARLHQWKGPRVKTVIMAFDDCAPMIEQSLKQIFANARSLDLGLLLGTQNISDFKNDDIDLRHAVLNNTALKFFVGVKDEGADYLQRASGETIRMLESEGRTLIDGPAGTGEGRQKGKREVIVPRITPEDIRRVNASDELAIVEALPPRGYTNLGHPTIVTLPRSITAAEYKAFAATPWPEPDGVRTVRSGDIKLAPIRPDEPPPAPPASPAPIPPDGSPPAPPGANPPKGRGKKTKQPDPAEVERARDIRDRLRRFGNDTP